MLYRGTFKNINNDDVALYILTEGDSSQTTLIGNSTDDDIQFSADPITIDVQPDNTMEVIFMKNCTINLVVKDYLGDSLFTSDARDIVVNVWKGDTCIFAGFVEPNVYTQPYAKYWDSLQLTCTCALSTLQYYPWRNIKTDMEYAEASTEADSIRIKDVLLEMFSNIGNLDIRHHHGYSVYYDGSVIVGGDHTGRTSIFDDVRLYEKLFLGEELDDVKMCNEILEMILRYYDLHIRQEGLDFFIWGWPTIRRHQAIDWVPVIGGESSQSNVYTVVRDRCTQDYREVLMNVNTGEEIPGNTLQKVLGNYVQDTGGEFRRYYNYILPNGSVVESTDYEVVDQTLDMPFIRIHGNIYKILEQTSSGDYDIDTLQDAPNAAYEGGSFRRPYFEKAENEYIISDK